MKLASLSDSNKKSHHTGATLSVNRFNDVNWVTSLFLIVCGIDVSWKFVPSYIISTIAPLGISVDARSVAPSSFLIDFAPSQFTLIVAAHVFWKFALKKNFWPATYAVGAGEYDTR